MDLPKNICKQLESEFHSSSYHILSEVVLGLNTLLGHFAKVSCRVCEWKKMEGVVIGTGISEDAWDIEYRDKTLLQFIHSQYVGYLAEGGTL